MENLDLLPSPQIKDGKMARFGFCATSSLIWADGGLLFHFISSKIVVYWAQMKNLQNNLELNGYGRSP